MSVPLAKVPLTPLAGPVKVTVAPDSRIGLPGERGNRNATAEKGRGDAHHGAGEARRGRGGAQSGAVLAG